MLREALAIQVDANKAVASAVAARDRGEGDEEIVIPFSCYSPCFILEYSVAPPCVSPSVAETAEGLMKP